VYEDLGPASLEPEASDERVAAAVDLIARLHERFRAHPALAECRSAATSYGFEFFEDSVRQAVAALETMGDSLASRFPGLTERRDRLLDRLGALEADGPRRSAALAESGGEDTLLHGDLWTSNVFVWRSAGGGLEARLVDWDRTGVGPASYDVSTLLLRFPPARRDSILARYRRGLRAATSCPFPARERLSPLFGTAGAASPANHVIWPGALGRSGGRRGCRLAGVERWFGTWRPVLPDEARAHAGPGPPRWVAQRRGS
jgi:aminoglycoside phosphotransferase (APT) family kinase protein